MCSSKQGADEFFATTRGKFQCFTAINIQNGGIKDIFEFMDASALDPFDKIVLREFQYFCYVKVIRSDKELPRHFSEITEDNFFEEKYYKQYMDIYGTDNLASNTSTSINDDRMIKLLEKFTESVTTKDTASTKTTYSDFSLIDNVKDMDDTNHSTEDNTEDSISVEKPYPFEQIFQHNLKVLIRAQCFHQDQVYILALSLH